MKKLVEDMVNKQLAVTIFPSLVEEKGLKPEEKKRIQVCVTRHTFYKYQLLNFTILFSTRRHIWRDLLKQRKKYLETLQRIH